MGGGRVAVFAVETSSSSLASLPDLRFLGLEGASEIEGGWNENGESLLAPPGGEGGYSLPPEESYAAVADVGPPANCSV